MKFTLPYNNKNPEDFLRVFLPYREHIHSFYFGLPRIFSSHNPYHEEINKTIQECANTYRFLELTKEMGFKTILCINTLVYPESLNQTEFVVYRELGPLIEQYGLSAVNIASPTLAQIIKDFFPDLEIQTSCNTFTFLNNMYQIWHEKFGTTVFNLPREALRTPWLMEQFKETGFVSKCIVNEGCIYGCPGNIEHACSFIMSNCAHQTFCDRLDYRLSDVFKSNFIPPHRLGEFEGKLDIAKIAGRGWPTENILKTFLAYLNQDPEADILTVLHSRTRRYLKESGIQLKAKDWPKKTLTCECKECSTCNICFKAMEHAIKKQGIDVSKLTRRSSFLAIKLIQMVRENNT